MKWSSTAPLIFAVLVAIFMSFMVLREKAYKPNAIPSILVIWIVIGVIWGAIYWCQKRDKATVNQYQDTVNTLLQEVAKRNHLQFDKFDDFDMGLYGVARGQGSVVGHLCEHDVSIGLDTPSYEEVDNALSSVSIAKNLDMIFAVMFRQTLPQIHEKVTLRKNLCNYKYERIDAAFSKCFKGKDLGTIAETAKKALLDFARGAKKLELTNQKILAVPKETQLKSVPEIENFLQQVIDLATLVEQHDIGH